MDSCATARSSDPRLQSTGRRTEKQRMAVPTRQRREFHPLPCVAGLLATLASCSPARRIEFILCPDDVHTAMSATADLGKRRELLFPLDYEVAIVERRNGAITPARVLRSGHAGSPARPTSITLADPAHVSDNFLLETAGAEVGIAIRREGEPEFRIQWLTPADLEAARKTALVHVPPLASLPNLPR